MLICCSPSGTGTAPEPASVAGSANLLPNSCSPGWMSTVATRPAISPMLAIAPGTVAMEGSGRTVTDARMSSVLVPLAISLVATSTSTVSMPFIARRSALAA